MNKRDRIKQVKNIAKNDKEAITMLLSACADMGSERGALLSVAKFDDAAEIILEYLAKRHLTSAMHTDGESIAVFEETEYAIDYVDSETIKLTRRR